jgi:hypothetical protein
MELLQTMQSVFLCRTEMPSMTAMQQYAMQMPTSPQSPSSPTTSPASKNDGGGIQSQVSSLFGFGGDEPTNPAATASSPPPIPAFSESMTADAHNHDPNHAQASDEPETQFEAACKKMETRVELKSVAVLLRRCAHMFARHRHNTFAAYHGIYLLYSVAYFFGFPVAGLLDIMTAYTQAVNKQAQTGLATFLHAFPDESDMADILELEDILNSSLRYL